MKHPLPPHDPSVRKAISTERIYLSLLVGLKLMGIVLFNWASLPDNFSSEIFWKLLLLNVISFFLLPMLLRWVLLIPLQINMVNNAIRVGPHQLPFIFRIAQQQCAKLGLQKMPSIYVKKGNGVFNAFATQVFGKRYVVLHDEVLKMANSKGGEEAVGFIIGHELSHIQRRHVSWWKYLLTFQILVGLPRSLYLLWVILFFAYSRAREFTCDAMGAFLAPGKAREAVLALAVGPSLYDKVDIEKFARENVSVNGLITLLAHLKRTHPPVIARFQRVDLQLMYQKKIVV